jgi:excisionase family DNA binding protein
MTFQSAAPMLSVRDISKHFHVGTLTVRRWIASGELKHLRVGNSIRCRVEDVQTFIDESTKKHATVERGQA